MTTRQLHALYFPAWARALKANWRTDRGCAVPADGRRTSDTLVQVEEAAVAAARRLMRAPKIEDLRHACHVVAIGRDKSSKDLNNAELDRVLAVLRILADPDDLSAVIARDNPETDARRRYEWAIAHSGHPEAYIRTIAGTKFGSGNWKALPMPQLKMLSMTLKNRRPVTDLPAAPAPARTLEPETANCPF